MLVPGANVTSFSASVQAMARKVWVESFTGSLPSDSKSAHEWKIPTQTHTQAGSLWQHVLILPPHSPLRLIPRPSFGSEEEEKLPSTLLYSVIRPKN